MAFWSALSLSLIGDMFSYIALAWLVLSLTGSGAALGAVLAVQGIPRVVFMLVGGAVSDHLSARLTMILSAAVRTLVAGALAALVLTHAATLWHVYVAAFLLGSVSAFFLPSSQSILPQLVDSELLEAGNAALQISKQGSNIVGPALAGLTVAAYGSGAAIAVDAACFAFAAGTLLMIRGGAAPMRGRPGFAAFMGSVREGLAFVWRSIPLRTLFAATTAMNFAFAGPFTVGLAILARQRLGGPAALGWTLGGFGAGAVLGAIVTGVLPRQPRRGWATIAVCLWLGAGMAVFGVLPNLIAVVVCGVLMGLVIGFANTFGMSWMQRYVEPAMLGRVAALLMLAAFGLGPLSYAVAGLLSQLPPAVTFAGGGAILVLTGLACASSRTFRSL